MPDTEPKRLVHSVLSKLAGMGVRPLDDMWDVVRNEGGSYPRYGVVGYFKDIDRAATALENLGFQHTKHDIAGVHWKLRSESDGVPDVLAVAQNMPGNIVTGVPLQIWSFDILD